MIRQLIIAGTVSSLACLAGCQNDTSAMSDTGSGYTDYGRVDQNGNRVYGNTNSDQNSYDRNNTSRNNNSNTAPRGSYGNAPDANPYNYNSPSGGGNGLNNGMNNNGMNNNGSRNYNTGSNPGIEIPRTVGPNANGSNGPSYVAGDRVYTNNPGTPVRDYGSGNNQSGNYNDQSGTNQSGNGQMNGTQSNNAADWSANWDDRAASRVSENDLPKAVRSTLASEANGANLSDTTKGTWNGQPAYSAKVLKNGHTYKMVTDANGNLITSRIID